MNFEIEKKNALHMFDIEPHDDKSHAFKTVVLNVLYSEWLLQLYL